jgi:hypothetical protein
LALAAIFLADFGLAAPTGRTIVALYELLALHSLGPANSVISAAAGGTFDLLAAATVAAVSLLATAAALALLLHFMASAMFLSTTVAFLGRNGGGDRQRGSAGG